MSLLRYKTISTLVLILSFTFGSSDAQRGGSGYNPGNSGGSQIINCQARGSGIHYCRANQLKSVELIRVLNHSGYSNPCLNNWGYRMTSLMGATCKTQKIKDGGRRAS